MGLWDDNANTIQPVMPRENRYLTDPNKGLELVLKILSTEEKQTDLSCEIKKFRRVLDEDYHQFAILEDLPDEVDAHDELDNIYREIEHLKESPDIVIKHKIAVAGGFSAGKSNFLNAFLKIGDALPVDTKPTTTIPTYVSLGGKKGITALNMFGNHIELDSDAFSAIAHQFKDVHGLSFTRILKHAVLNAESNIYNKIIFIDTPGYTKSETPRRIDDNTDEKSAHNQVSEADFLIWLIDIENGTIQDNDLSFLKTASKMRSPDKGELPIYFVFNKSDKKPDSEIKKVCLAAINILKNKELNVVGLSAYSSHDVEERIYKGKGLDSFLSSINKKPTSDKLFLSERVKVVFQKYKGHNKKRLKEEREILSILNKFALQRNLPDFQHVLTEIWTCLLKKRYVSDELSMLSKILAFKMIKKDNSDELLDKKRKLILELKDISTKIDQIEKKILNHLGKVLKILNIREGIKGATKANRVDEEKRCNYLKESKRFIRPIINFLTKLLLLFLGISAIFIKLMIILLVKAAKILSTFFIFCRKKLWH